MKIALNSVMVDDQEKALAFYTQMLGFEAKQDIPLGEYRWLTVVSPEARDGAELLLEPNHFPPAKTYQAALYEAGIPATSFAVDDVAAEYDRLRERGVKFSGAPTEAGTATVAVLDDTCGNLIQIYQV